MSEKAPSMNNQEINDLVTVDDNGKGHRPDGKFLSNKHMEMIAEHQDQIRDGISERNGEASAPIAKAEMPSVSVSNSGELRPIEDGEYDIDLQREENSNPDHED